MIPRGCGSLWLCVLVHLTHVSVTLACILLLNGWAPLSVRDRAALADIVLTGDVISAFKLRRTEHGTYTAQIRILTLHKGLEHVRRVIGSSDVTADDVTGGYNRLYNVSNFGDRAACYADVTSGRRYVFFLTVHENRLSAQYDDIFGAAAPYSLEDEQEVLDYLGWRPWTPWSPCSQSCGSSGRQARSRTCSHGNRTLCEGSPAERRHCNTFSCADVVDLLSKFGIPGMPFGVTRSADRHDAYVISHVAKLFLPASALYDVTFPVDFSLSMTSRRKTDKEGYVFVLSDISGRQRLAVYLGRELRVEIMDDPSRETTVLRHDVTETHDDVRQPRGHSGDGAPPRWQHVALSLQGGQLVLYLDCRVVMETRVDRGDNSLGTNLMLSIGPYFNNFGPAFEGELEQLLLSEDPSMAQRQCFTQSGDHMGPVKDDSSSDFRGDVERTTRPPSKGNNSKSTQRPSIARPADWSAWSDCSASCGKGRQSRSQSCTGLPARRRASLVVVVAKETAATAAEEVEAADASEAGRQGNCVPNATPLAQVRACSAAAACAVSCARPCDNGGTCEETTGRCLCSHGYHGDHCQTAVCTPNCQNGGACTAPGRCSCPKNFTGINCDTPSCNPSCLNGGRCTSAGVCACPYGYTGNNCQPYCRQACHNGGRCARHDVCRCLKGYTGRLCQTPVCRRGCSNGGRCVSPNRCSCPVTYRGRSCHKPRCRPSCKNGGTCIAPGVCLCPYSTQGQRCQKFKCSKKCRNGGVCAAHGKCQCKAPFYGRFCHKERCTLTCQNGGRCRRHKNRCRCPKGFHGRRCERRTCVYERYSMPYRRTYRRTVRQQVMTSCPPRSWRPCVRNILKYITVSRDTVRTAYRCV